MRIYGRLDSLLIAPAAMSAQSIGFSSDLWGKRWVGESAGDLTGLAGVASTRKSAQKIETGAFGGTRSKEQETLSCLGFLT